MKPQRAFFGPVTGWFRVMIPAGVREALELGPGDAVLFNVQGSEVTLYRVAQAEIAYLQSLEGTLHEWASGYDEAYGSL